MTTKKIVSASRGRGLCRPQGVSRPLSEESRNVEVDVVDRLKEFVIEPRGRGIARNYEALRRPGEFESVKDRYSTLRKKLYALKDPGDSSMEVIVSLIEELCKTSSDLEAVFAIIYEFCMKSKVNASVGAVIFSRTGDLKVDTVKMKHLLVGKMQAEYEAKESLYNSAKEQFLMNGFFLHEILYRLRFPNDICCEILVSPAVDYFIMMLNGGTDKDIEVFTEQIPKVYKDIAKHQPKRLNELIQKMRSTIVSSCISESSRACLLRLLELINNNWSPLDSVAEDLYRRYMKQS